MLQTLVYGLPDLPNKYFRHSHIRSIGSALPAKAGHATTQELNMNRNDENRGKSSGARSKPLLRKKAANTASTATNHAPDDEQNLQHVEIEEKDILGRIFNNGPVYSFARYGEKWFYAIEVCRALGLANPRDAISRLEPGEKGVGINLTRGGPQEVNVVNESGLYALIFSSRKPLAKAFRRWVTSEVLPALRTTGSYAAGMTIGEPLSFDPTEQARYVVTVMPNTPPHIRKTSLDLILDEWSALDTEILASQIRTIDALWQKTQLVRSIGSDPAGSPLYDQLGTTITECRRLADEYLRHSKIGTD